MKKTTYKNAIITFGFNQPFIKKGVKFDGGKLRYELLDDVAMDEVVAVLTYGGELYEAENWRVVPNAISRYVGALRRHTSAIRRGELYDLETGLLHAAHAECCTHFINALVAATVPDISETLPARLAKALVFARAKKAAIALANNASARSKHSYKSARAGKNNGKKQRPG